MNSELEKLSAEYKKDMADGDFVEAAKVKKQSEEIMNRSLQLA
jgi:hypothetical protein